MHNEENFGRTRAQISANLRPKVEVAHARDFYTQIYRSLFSTLKKYITRKHKKLFTRCLMREFCFQQKKYSIDFHVHYRMGKLTLAPTNNKGPFFYITIDPYPTQSMSWRSKNIIEVLIF